MCNPAKDIMVQPYAESYGRDFLFFSFLSFFLFYLKFYPSMQTKYFPVSIYNFSTFLTRKERFAAYDRLCSTNYFQYVEDPEKWNFIYFTNTLPF